MTINDLHSAAPLAPKEFSGDVPATSPDVPPCKKRHQLALALMQMAAVPTYVLQWLVNLPDRTLPMIWGEAPPSDGRHKPEALDLFKDACDIMATIPIVSAELTCTELADRFDRLLMVIGSVWRDVPPGLLAKMLLVLPPAGAPCDALLDLQLQHVAAWSCTRRRRMISAPRRDWAVFVASALKWRHHDESALRMHPRAWAHPLCSLRVIGFELIAVDCTAHMVGAQGHKGALCNGKVADACERGTEAWWLVRSALGVPFPSNCIPVDAALALVVDPEVGWRVGPVLAPPHALPAALRIARSLAAQATVLERQKLLRDMALPNATHLHDVHDALVALLQQHGSHTPSEKVEIPQVSG